MHVVVGREQPSRGIGLPRLDLVLPLPRPDVPELVDQLARIDYVVPYGQVGADREVRYPHVQQRQVVRVHEERYAGVPRLVEDLHRVRIERVPQHLVEQLGGPHREVEVELRVAPPLQGTLELLLARHTVVERELLTADLAALQTVYDDVENPVPVLVPEGHDARIESRRVALHPGLDLVAGGPAPPGSPSELAEQVQHIPEELGLGTAGTAVHGEPQLPYGRADRDGSPQIEVHEIAAVVVHVVEQPDGRQVTPR